MRLRQPDVSGMGDVGQRLLFLVGVAAFWGFFLLGMQAVFIRRGRTHEDLILLGVFAAVSVVAGVLHRCRRHNARVSTEPPLRSGG